MTSCSSGPRSSKSAEHGLLFPDFEQQDGQLLLLSSGTGKGTGSDSISIGGAFSNDENKFSGDICDLD